MFCRAFCFYAPTKGQPVCAGVSGNNACVRLSASCLESRKFYSCGQSPVTVKVNTLASKRAELIGNAASCSKAPRNPQKGDLSVLASTSYHELLGTAGTQGRLVAGCRALAVSYSSTIHHCYQRPLLKYSRSGRSLNFLRASSNFCGSNCFKVTRPMELST